MQLGWCRATSSSFVEGDPSSQDTEEETVTSSHSSTWGSWFFLGLSASFTIIYLHEHHDFVYGLPVSFSQLLYAWPLTPGIRVKCDASIQTLGIFITAVSTMHVISGGWEMLRHGTLFNQFSDCVNTRCLKCWIIRFAFAFLSLRVSISYYWLDWRTNMIWANEAEADHRHPHATNLLP